jgi:hypothetical protein
MSQNMYEPEKLLARAREWRIEAAAATTPEMRAFCLGEATRCEMVVRQSLETPAVSEDAPAQGASPIRMIRRAFGIPSPRRSPAKIRATTDRR